MSVDDTKIEKLKRRLFSNSGEEVPPVPRVRLQKHQVLVKEAWEEDPTSENPVMHPFDITVKNTRQNTNIEKNTANNITTNTGTNSNPANLGGVKIPQTALQEQFQSLSQTQSQYPQTQVHKITSGMDLREKEDGDPRGSFIKKALGFSVILFILAASFGSYVIFSGTNSVSNNNIDINLVGPVTSAAGEELSLDVDITNRNTTDLVLTDLVITYPEGTRKAEDKVTSMPIDRVDVGTIPRGKTVRQTIKSVLFGEENARKNIRVTIEYRIEGSSNVFVKEKDYPIFIGSSPISVTVDSQSEVVPEQEHDFNIKIKSNSASLIKGLVFKAEYPFGFQFISALPSTTGDQSTWVLGDIQPGEERNITVKGRVLGGEQQERVFRFYTGTEDVTDKTNIGTIFVTNTETVVLKKPFLSADLALDGKTSAVYVAKAGTDIRGEITWQNNLNIPLNDVVIEARITGPMLDKTAVRGDQGFYRSTDNTVVWDKTSVKTLGEVKPGSVGRFQFSFAALKPTIDNNSNFRKQSLKVELSLRAKRLNEDKVPEEIASNVSRTVQISSDISATTRLVRTVGPFVNTGPVPPIAETPTTYTVLVSLKNSFNNVKDVVYTATLPQYVTWLGQTYPSANGVSYNPDSRQITWQIGDIQPGIGYSSSAKEVAYQVSLLPSLGQNGSTPQVITDQKVLGKDTFTGKIIEVKPEKLDIKTESEPTYKYGDDKVGGEK